MSSEQNFGYFFEDYFKSFSAESNYQHFINFLTQHLGIPRNHSILFGTIFSDNNRSILMIVCKYNFYQICEEIVQRYPQSINLVNNQGYTALHYAAFYGHMAIVQLLINFGGHIFIKNNYSEYSFDSASISGHTDLEYVMLSKFLFGFDPFLNPSSYPVVKCSNPTSPPSSSSSCSLLISSVDQSKRNLEFIEQHNHNLWSSSLTFPLLLDKYLLNSSQSSEILSPQQTSATTLPLLTNNINSFENISFLQKYNLTIQKNLSNGKELIGKEFDLFATLTSIGDNHFHSITIGRSHSNTIILDDLSISKLHCELNYFTGIGLCLKDCQSRHGTAVDGVIVTPSCTLLKSAATNRDSGNRTTMAIIKYPTSVITLGRVVLGFTLKPMDNTVAKKFQPNQDIGKRLYEATRLSQQMSQNNSSFSSNKSQPQFHLDPLLPYHLISSMIQPAAAAVSHSTTTTTAPTSSSQATTTTTTTTTSIEIHQQQQSSSLSSLSSLSASSSSASSSSSSNQINDIDSESYVGRNLLLKMGWEKGIKLGRSGDVDHGPIQVMNKQDKMGIGMSLLPSSSNNNHNNNKRKISHEEKLKLTKSRYDSTVS